MKDEGGRMNQMSDGKKKPIPIILKLTGGQVGMLTTTLRLQVRAVGLRREELVQFREYTAQQRAHYDACGAILDPVGYMQGGRMKLYDEVLARVDILLKIMDLGDLSEKDELIVKQAIERAEQDAYMREAEFGV